MHELLDTGLHNCVRQYAMEIHMPGPLASEKNMARCKDIYSMLVTLEEKGFKLYETVDNYRAVKYYNPSITRQKIKENQFQKRGDIVLWENYFVNVNVKDSCREYLQ